MSEFKIPEQWRQTTATVIVNLLSVHIGVFLCWTVTGHPTEWFGGNATTISFAITKQGFKIIEETPLDSTLAKILPFISILILLPLVILIGERFGRKLALSASIIPFTIATLTIAAGKGPLIVFEIFSAVACAMQLYLVPMYISEISDNNSRGAHGVIRTLLMGIGCYLGYYNPDIWLTPLYAVFSLLLPMMFLIGLKVLPESPVWLVENKRISEAKKALAWLRNEDELLDDSEAVRLNGGTENIEETSPCSGRIKAIFKSAKMRQEFLVIFVLVIGQGIIQINCFDIYTIIVFGMREWIPNQNLMHLIIIVIHIVTCSAALLLVDRIGRRPLLIISSIAMAVLFCAGMICFFMLDGNFFGHPTTPEQKRDMLSALAIFYYIFYIFGIGSVSSVSALEILPDRISYGISMIVYWIAPWIARGIRYSSPLLIFYSRLWWQNAVVCVFLAIFVTALVLETKGRSIYPRNRE